jgi:hypothetical protein
MNTRLLSRVCALALAGVACVAAARLSASGSMFWTVASPADLLRGTSNGVYVGLDGAVTAGPQLVNRLRSTPAQIWSLAAGADGTWWAGTGGDGKVLRLRAGQPEETAFDSEETNVFALAVSGTRVYAATGPDGKVYVIDGAATPRVFFDPSEKYIWALAVDAVGRLWVGAGNPAVIYRVDADGTSHVVYHPPAAHVVCLVRDGQGRMLAGTESPGRLYRFDANDKPFVLLDSGQTELRAAAVASDGTIYAAAVSKGDDSSSSSGETTSIALAGSSTSTSAPTASSSAASTSSTSDRSTIFRIAEDGSWEPFWSTPDAIYDVAAIADGGVLAASGPEGRLYRIDRLRQAQLLTGVDAKQITHFGVGTRPDTSPAAIATAKPGRVVMITTGAQSPATYLSPVRDTKGPSTWGTIRWESLGDVTLFSRAGNTDRPDDSWSDWAGPYTHASGDALKSPAGRFLQWKAVLTSPASGVSPRLTSVTVAYLPANTRPTVTSITVSPPGVVFQKPFSSEDGAVAGLDESVAEARRPPGDGATPPSPGRRMFQKGLQTLQWKADDTDSDHLSYTLQYRRAGELTWHDLRAGLTDTIFVWDTTTVPDGRYIVRVTVTDAPSNTAERAMTNTRESDPIDIDNTPPAITSEVTHAANGAIRLSVHVHDAQSALQKVEFVIGDGAWRLLSPVDGLTDSPDERFEIPLASEADAARIVIRATDALQNVTAQPAAIR